MASIKGATFDLNALEKYKANKGPTGNYYYKLIDLSIS